jgi:citrate lyase beta subunit
VASPNQTPTLRINAADTEWFDGDVALVQGALPADGSKVQSAAQIAFIMRRRPSVPVTVLNETASGIVNSAEYAHFDCPNNDATGHRNLRQGGSCAPADITQLRSSAELSTAGMSHRWRRAVEGAAPQ